jgi:hypothetical protein
VKSAFCAQSRSPIKKEAAHQDGLAGLGVSPAPVTPPHLAGPPNVIANSVEIQIGPVEFFGLLQIGHCRQ